MKESAYISVSRDLLEDDDTQAEIAPGAGAFAPPVVTQQFTSDSYSGCERCGQANHIKSQCYAKFHVSGARLLSAKSVPVPPDVAAQRKARWDALQEAKHEEDQNWDEQVDDELEVDPNAFQVTPKRAAKNAAAHLTENVVSNLEYSEEMSMYREMVDRTMKTAGHAVTDDFDPEINMMEGNYIFEVPTEDTPVPITEDEESRLVISQPFELESVAAPCNVALTLSLGPTQTISVAGNINLNSNLSQSLGPTQTISVAGNINLNSNPSQSLGPTQTISVAKEIDPNSNLSDDSDSDEDYKNSDNHPIQADAASPLLESAMHSEIVDSDSKSEEEEDEDGKVYLVDDVGRLTRLSQL